MKEEELAALRPLHNLVIAAHDVIVAGELLAEYSELRADAPEDYAALWREQADVAIELVRLIRYGGMPNVHETESARNLLRDSCSRTSDYNASARNRR